MGPQPLLLSAADASTASNNSAATLSAQVGTCVVALENTPRQTGHLKVGPSPAGLVLRVSPAVFLGSCALPFWLALRALPVRGLLGGAQSVRILGRRRGDAGVARLLLLCWGWPLWSMAFIGKGVGARLGCNFCNCVQVCNLAVKPLGEQVEGAGVPINVHADDPRRSTPLGLFLSWVPTRHLDCID